GALEREQRIERRRELGSQLGEARREVRGIELFAAAPAREEQLDRFFGGSGAVVHPSSPWLSGASDCNAGRRRRRARTKRLLAAAGSIPSSAAASSFERPSKCRSATISR